MKAASPKLLEIRAWGSLHLGNGADYFNGCPNLTITATDAPGLGGTTTLRGAFSGCGSLKTVPGIEAWDVSGITDMQDTFEDVPLNQPIEGWDVSSVLSMYGMFEGASSFDQDIGNWDVSRVTDMQWMFNQASSFDQDISSWNVSGVRFMTGMFSGVSLSTANYDALLIHWSQLDLQPGVSFDAGNSQYSYRGAAARESIIETYGWNITDGGGTSLQDLSIPVYLVTSFLACLIGGLMIVVLARQRRRSSGRIISANRDV